MSVSMNRRALLAAGAAATFVAASAPAMAQGAAPDGAMILDAMKRAARFMTEEAAVEGGYVWQYLPDFSRRWGELEAAPTMIWVQPPGTATMGHLFLDAYHATGDDFYYDAAKSAADALVRGQHPAGGWNYVIDTAGEESLKRWYGTVGKNAWRLEEFHRYYGNATFDDAGTAEASQLLLRVYLERRERQYLAPLQKAIGFVLDSQYANGGWPQRYPFVQGGGVHGHADYTPYITFNDDVAGENIEFLIYAWHGLARNGRGDARVLDAIHRGMDIFVKTQQPQPQPAWGLQHFPDTLKPAPARTIEPQAFVTHATGTNIRSMLGFYRLTGDRKFLQRLPEAMDWLDQVASPAELRGPGRTHPTFVLEGANTPVYIHRRGSNVANGQYYADANPQNLIVHYGSFRNIDTPALRREYERLSALAVEEATQGSPLKVRPGSLKLPTYFTLQDVDVWDMSSDARRPARPAAARVAEIMSGLNARGYWATPLTTTSNPYRGDSPVEVTGGEYQMTRVGDVWDTSPYNTDFPVEGVSTSVFIRNMGDLIEALGA
ncbi:pectate lyase [Brevundimonas sp. PAMC22021]|uniref:pectate lyase n=1 Tax=Brevundimonas sp. PAMC22021 TaxID=2861285 RepID=UPI001C63375D|nr:pectate lyase [Brevundimonas sp. PAMC22021]QYF87727.1 pectate lyase [Brevundimonas sp. PAMC22021]